MTRITLPSGLRRTSCSVLALATVMAFGATPANAQFVGSMDSSAGIDTGTSTNSNINVTGQQAVINWTATDDPSGGQIVFLPDGNSVTFSGATDFAVLNRVAPGTPGNAIYLGGTINSLVGDVTGGTVFFYSPDGIVVGQNAFINVGSLGLTTLPIADDGNGNWMTGFGGSNPTVNFGQATNPNSYVRTLGVIDGGISAPNEGSYVALVAPIIQHHGSINVNGAAALVAAEAATITFRPSGLFDIQVDVGTTDSTGIAMDGSIGGPASSGSGDYHRIYAVAVPKNTALTMLIANGAELGFDVAQSADVVGNSVVLSAGHDVFFGGASFDPSAASGAPASIRVQNSTFTSAVSADATGDVELSATAGQAAHFFSDVDLRALTGHIQVSAFGSDAQLDVDGNLTLNTDHFGQSDGESVTAGQASVYSQAGGILNVDGNLNISANGYGGNSFESGVDAGNGTGGVVQVQAEAGSSLNVGGNVFVTADGYGGQPGAAGVNAGDGTGGSVYIGTLGDNASLGISSTVTASANGSGGDGGGPVTECFSCNGLGGNGTGGGITLGTGQGTGSTAFFGDIVQLNADGTGGTSLAADSSSGTGNGGTVTVQSAGGSPVEGYGTYLGSDVILSASGFGGESLTPGIAAGLGQGGTVHIRSDANSTMAIFGDLEADADGSGGTNTFDVDGGDGLGGHVIVSAQGGNSAIEIFGAADLEADGDASIDNSDCVGCGGTGGQGIGGIVQVSYADDSAANGTNNFISFGNSLSLSAEGYGGIGGTGIAGLGRGGNAFIGAGAGLNVTVGAGLSIEADGNGGYGYNGNGGGAGRGGTAAIYGNGGSITVTGNSTLDAGGFGGDTGVVSGGNAGTGTGGVAQVYAPGGTVDFNGSLFANAAGEGGNALGGVGGSALGGSARVESGGGAIHITGNLSLDGGATGGAGLTGGNATGLVSPLDNETLPTAVMIIVQNGGSVDVDGVAVLSAEAVGGNGSNGNGGNAQAGEADVIVFTGAMDINSLSIDTNAYGGNGGGGGNGGNAFGGPVDVAFGLNAAPISGTMTLGSATITADGEGGDGGTGASGATGATGGAGGNGSGGRVSFTGSAAGGTLSSGTATITALGAGGAGGAGGTGSAGVGGNGGAGGIGTGGNIQTGTISNENSPNSGGGATYANLTLRSDATGGNGGAGGTGSSGNGTGGNGGGAVGGTASFLARGVLVSADAVIISANATGGNGGLGATQGNGGNARSGSFAVEAKERFGHADERGRLEADSITGEAIATGGDGATDGIGSVIGGTYFRLLNGDADIGSISFNTAGDVYDNSFANSTVSVRDGIATLGDFTFTTTGELALDASNGSMTAGTITLSASNFIPDLFTIDQDGPQTGPGTYSAGAFDITTGGNFVTNAHLVSAGSLDIIAPGLIDMRNATSSDGNLTLTAGSSILAGNLNAAGFVSVLGTGNVAVGNVISGDFVDIESETGDIATGDLSAVSTIDLDAAGSTGFGDVVAEALDFDSGGAVTGGNILAAREVKGQAGGAIGLGDISVGISMTGGPADGGIAVGIISATSINVGNIEADENIGFATFGTLTTGNLSSGGNIMALASGDMSFGAMTTTGENGQIYLADSSMFTDAGGPDEFDPSLVLSAEPVPTGGSITINGPVSTNLFRAAAGGNFTAGDITALGFFDDALFIQGIHVRAGGTATVDGIWTGENVGITSNDIDIAAGGGIDAGSVALASTNATRTIIGDGVDGSGYRLSDAEFDRIHSSGGEIEVGVNGSLGGALNMVIGDLSVDADVAGAEEYEFATYQTDSEEGSGTIRVVGDMAFTNMGDIEIEREVSFTSETFELDAATGSVFLRGGGSELAGSLDIAANHIHVAQGSILDQLAENPQYDGYQDDLNAPAQVQRPDGVIGASFIDLEFGGTPADLYTLYVQNTGTAETPAGFVISDLFLDGDGEGGLPPNSLDVVINGQIDTGDGMLTGIDVRDALVESEGDLTPFTANSTINGCLLTGACVEVPDNPLPPDFTPTPGIQDEVILLGDDPLPPPPFGNEDIIDDNDEETEDTSPIVPPQPLFDTSELGEAEGTGNPAFNTTMRSSPAITQEGDVDDPVSGSGNPGLMEAGGSDRPGDGSQPPAPPPPAGNKETQQ
jgi:filamentous hemagglutinin family protein